MSNPHYLIYPTYTDCLYFGIVNFSSMQMPSIYTYTQLHWEKGEKSSMACLKFMRHLYIILMCNHIWHASSNWIWSHCFLENIKWCQIRNLLLGKKLPIKVGHNSKTPLRVGCILVLKTSKGEKYIHDKIIEGSTRLPVLWPAE